MYSSLPLYILYLFFKVLVRTSFGLFYPRTRVLGKKHLRLQGPTVVASNHPNTLIDPLATCSRVDEQVFFLVNAGLYKNAWMARVFNALYCIPIERPQDVNGRPVRNEEAFARCDDHLGRGGHLFVAPEGGSEMEYRLRPIKTGTARIALSAESKNDFGLNLRILPIGLTYSDPPHMGSSLLMQVGDPILIADYQDLYRKDARQAVKKITAELRRRLSDLTLDTTDAEEEDLIVRIDQILQHHRPLDLPEAFQRNRRLLRRLRQLEKTDPAARTVFVDRLRRYAGWLTLVGLSDQAFSRRGGLPARLAGVVLGFPLFVLGFLPNALPYFIPRWVEKKLGLYVGYAATVKILLGLLTFSLAYGLFFWLVGQWLPPIPALALTLLLIPLGYFAWYYGRQWEGLVMALRGRRVRRHQPDRWEAMQQERAWLVDRLEVMAAAEEAVSKTA